ncbi:MAG: hypothetical protein ACTSP4_06385 [Candidatus Hodarchaeales archaeon]
MKDKNPSSREKEKDHTSLQRQNVIKFLNRRKTCSALDYFWVR